MPQVFNDAAKEGDSDIFDILDDDELIELLTNPFFSLTESQIGIAFRRGNSDIIREILARDDYIITNEHADIVLSKGDMGCFIHLAKRKNFELSENNIRLFVERGTQAIGYLLMYRPTIEIPQEALEKTLGDNNIDRQVRNKVITSPHFKPSADLVDDILNNKIPGFGIRTEFLYKRIDVRLCSERLESMVLDENAPYDLTRAILSRPDFHPGEKTLVQLLEVRYSTFNEKIGRRTDFVLSQKESIATLTDVLNGEDITAAKEALLSLRARSEAEHFRKANMEAAQKKSRGL